MRVILSCLAAVAVTLLACGCASQARGGTPGDRPSPEPSGVASPEALTPAQMTFTPGVGQRFSVVLPSLSTAGYEWHLLPGFNAGFVKPLGTHYGPVPDPPLAGASPNEIFDFQALKAGATTLTFVQYRPWEGADHPASTRNHAVNVR